MRASPQGHIMTVLVNSFGGGTSGTTVTTGNSGGASGNAWDFVAIGTGATVAYDNTHSIDGPLACHVANDATGAAAALYWTSSLGTQSQVWFRGYLYFTAYPTNDVQIYATYDEGSALVSDTYIEANTGLITVQDTNFDAIFTTANPIPLNQWFRIEGFVIGNAAVGQVQLKVFDNANSATPTETLTSAATQDTAGAMTQYIFGIISAANQEYWMANLGVSTQGYLGPVEGLLPGDSINLPSVFFTTIPTF